MLVYVSVYSGTVFIIMNHGHGWQKLQPVVLRSHTVSSVSERSSYWWKLNAAIWLLERTCQAMDTRTFLSRWISVGVKFLRNERRIYLLAENKAGFLTCLLWMNFNWIFSQLQTHVATQQQQTHYLFFPYASSLFQDLPLYKERLEVTFYEGELLHMFSLINRESFNEAVGEYVRVHVCVQVTTAAVQTGRLLCWKMCSRSFLGCLSAWKSKRTTSSSSQRFITPKKTNHSLSTFLKILIFICNLWSDWSRALKATTGLRCLSVLLPLHHLHIKSFLSVGVWHGEEIQQGGDHCLGLCGVQHHEGMPQSGTVTTWGRQSYLYRETPIVTQHGSLISFLYCTISSVCLRSSG